MIDFFVQGITLLTQIFFPETQYERDLRIRHESGTFPRAPRTPYPWLFALASYKSPLIKKCIYRIKRMPSRTLCTIFAEHLHARIIKEFPDEEQYLLVPIPLSADRKRARGYNQSELLIRYLMKQDSRYYYSPLLSKIKSTRKQARITSRAMRSRNMDHAFTAVSSPPQNMQRLCIIIDDVTTTGATLGEARRALQSSGYERIIACTLAH
ncbi:MAG: hypothetical protein LRY41_02525 [Candidatus Pacebacteria bacterium]|nr:hypothetical protein [Candidatus Paceibacterota bacterium]MCD8508190.1 hypothetical protein [Candidatus Paceibacterota bacterium]MCD8528178.1 hypothetical protein [Candidatus Paceibacterota bacterium]MCD8563447.1 hypothetical protein [Candidatus Paceibacterota bacterium]